MSALRSISISWNVHVPKRPPRSRSSSFHLGDTEWYLSCSENKKGNVSLNLCHEDGPLAFGNLSLKVDVEGGFAGRMLPFRLTTEEWCPSGNLRIWIGSTEDIEWEYPKFRWQRQLTFNVTFYEWGASLAGIDYALSKCRENSTPSTDRPSSSKKTKSPIENKKSSSAKDASVQASPCSNPSLCLESLLEDFAKMLDREDSNADVELHCAELTTRAHRAVLCVRSPVLASMLTSDMVEGRTGVVDIKDMDTLTFQRFLRYLYTTELEDLTFDAAIGLYEAGDMYQVRSLARRCSRFLMENLTVENACDILVMADAHSDSSFVDDVISFMVQEKVPLSGESWRVFSDSHPKLANEVLTRMCGVLSK